MSALQVKPDQTRWTEDQLAALRRLGVDGAGAGDLALLLSYAQRTGLDPFSRQVYMIGRRDGRQGQRWTIQSSIDGLRIVAGRSGEYAGQDGPHFCGKDGVWHDVWLHDGPPAAARVGVRRSTFAEPLYAVALWTEYRADSTVWRKMPSIMLAKCAEALALRKAFPDVLSGIYTADEMAHADHGPAAPVPPARPSTMTLDEVVAGIVMAESPDELRAVWRAAHEGDLLEARVGDVERALPAAAGDPEQSVSALLAATFEALTLAEDAEADDE